MPEIHFPVLIFMASDAPVSYTHLDVYKRQIVNSVGNIKLFGPQDPKWLKIEKNYRNVIHIGKHAK